MPAKGKPGNKGNTSGARYKGGPPRKSYKLTKAAAKELKALAEEWEVDAAALLSHVVLTAPRNLFQVAADCVREMGGAEKIREKEDKPIIL